MQLLAARLAQLLFKLRDSQPSEADRALAFLRSEARRYTLRRSRCERAFYRPLYDERPGTSFEIAAFELFPAPARKPALFRQRSRECVRDMTSSGFREYSSQPPFTTEASRSRISSDRASSRLREDRNDKNPGSPERASEFRNSSKPR